MQLMTRLQEAYEAFTSAIAEQSRIQQDELDRGQVILSYCVSAFAIMSMLTAVVVNRIMLFAATTRRKQLPFMSRTFLRLVSVYFLIRASYGILVCLKFYYPSRFVSYALQSARFDFDPATFSRKSFLGMHFCTRYIEYGLNARTGNGTTGAIARTKVAEGALSAVKHIVTAVSDTLGGPNGTGQVSSTAFGPSASVLKPLFLAMSINQVILAFISIAGGVTPYRDNSLTLFEYSIAFHETQSISYKPSFELLVLCLFEVFRQLMKHIFAIFRLTRYRLACSTALELTFMAFFVRVLALGRIVHLPVFIVFGYLPFVICFAVLIFSLLIYAITGLLKGSFGELSMTSLIRNFSVINISASDDFYTALVAISSFTMRSSIQEGYLHEKSSIVVPKSTYLEDKAGHLLKSGHSGYGTKLQTTDSGAAKPTAKVNWIVAHRFAEMKRVLVQFAGFMKVSACSLARRGSETPDETRNSDIPQLKAGSDGNSRLPVTHIQQMSENELSQEYAHVLLETEIQGDDDSNDYIPPEGAENTEMVEQVLNKDTEEELKLEKSAFSDLVDPREFCSLVRPTNADDFIESRIMEYHLRNIDSPVAALTRSGFSKYYGEDMKLMDLIHERRVEEKGVVSSLQGDDWSGSSPDSEDGHADMGTCVICHVNSRQIILWPCKCFAICDRCRVALYMRNFKTCVCCRSKVVSYSKVYVP